MNGKSAIYLILYRTASTKNGDAPTTVSQEPAPRDVSRHNGDLPTPSVASLFEELIILGQRHRHPFYFPNFLQPEFRQLLGRLDFHLSGKRFPCGSMGLQKDRVFALLHEKGHLTANIDDLACDFTKVLGSHTENFQCCLERRLRKSHHPSKLFIIPIALLGDLHC